MKSIWWIKRDMRLHDNQAFYRACEESTEVLPCYVFEPLVLHGPDASVSHAEAMRQGINSLQKNLIFHEIKLALYHGEIISSLEKLRKEFKFQKIYSYQEIGLKHTFDRDKVVSKWCKANNIEWIEIPYPGVIRGKLDRDNYHVHMQKYLDDKILRIPKCKNKLSNIIVTKGIKNIPSLKELGFEHAPQKIWPVSEKKALETLDSFLYKRAHGYSGGISSMNTAPEVCSRLSIHLAWGAISLRLIFKRTQKRYDELALDSSTYAFQMRKSLQSFTSRLFWHSHFIQKLETEVEMEFKSQNRALEKTLPFVSDDIAMERIELWSKGQTGFPLVDAYVRYYNYYGWLNFRGRAMITSFAIHALRIPWQLVMYELAKKMSDYVPGIHVTQIQMQAGLAGINTLRIYSPQKQIEDHDPHGIFIKSWVPELIGYEGEEILMHQSTPLPGYSKPIIDFKAETKIYKDAWYAIKKTNYFKSESQRVYLKHGSRKKRRA